MKKKYIYICLILFTFFCVYAQSDDRERAFDAYRFSRWGEAVILFGRVWDTDPTDEEALLYLALSQQRNEAFDAAETSFKDGIAYNGVLTGKFSLFYGNLLFSMQRFVEAEEVYSALIVEGAEWGNAALLNRANLKMNTQRYQEAVGDYEAYLVADPGNPQEGSIRELISLLKDQTRREEEAAATEAKRLVEEQKAAEEAALLAEEQRIADEKRMEEERQEAERVAEEERIKAEALAEEQRIADEIRRKEEEQRQQELLDNILNSLSNAGDETQVFSAGSEEIVIEEEESGIEE